jgi:Na+-driven multidrug efflux pump
MTRSSSLLLATVISSSSDDEKREDEPTIIATTTSPRQKRYRNLVPTMDGLDRRIIGTALPSMVNLAVVPIVNAVDTFWVGRMGVALALAGQGAANQAFFTLFFLVNYLPTITAPLVATAVGSGDVDLARRRVCESLFLSSLLGACGTILLCGFPRIGLAPLLDANAPAMEYAVPYLRVRALSLVPALIGSTGFAAFRGSLDTVTPLKVSLAAKYVSCLFVCLFEVVLAFCGGC